jgi:glycosyltransferase involved in cell wall biosynthesis
MGDSFSLLIANLTEASTRFAAELADQLGVGESVRTVRLGDDDWPAALRGASALLHGGGRRNAGLLRWALASGLPVAALSTPITEAVLGPAGFLAPERDSRGLGAACLTLLVEEAVAGSLRERGLDRATRYRLENATAAWREALTGLPQS